jgi:hypothetical protein
VQSILQGTEIPTELVITAPETSGGFSSWTKIEEAAEIYEGRVGIDVLWPGNMAMYRSAMDDIGDFDERLGAGCFPSSEDNDFGFRAS